MTDFRPGRFQILPPVVKTIIIINVIMVVIQYFLGRVGINLGDYLGLHYWDSPFFRWWQIITHLFMHGDPYNVSETFWHIFSNMFALWMFGSVLENVWGPRRFIIFYFICGLGAAFCHLLVLSFEYHNFQNAFLAYQLHPSVNQLILFMHHHHLDGVPQLQQIQLFWSSHPDCSNCAQDSFTIINEVYRGMINETTVGASGAIMGVLFAFGYLFPNTLLYFYFLVPIKAKWFVAGYALLELYLGIQNSAGDNIAHFAHLGGMLFAFILLKIWNSRIKNRFY